MKKKRLRHLFVYGAFMLLLLFLVAFFTLPKFLLIDREVSRAGFYMTAKKVHEGFTDVNLKDVHIYRSNEKVVSFDSLRISLGFFRLIFEGRCRDGNFRAELSPWSKRIRFDKFKCLTRVEMLNSDLTVANGFFGKVLLKGIKVEDLSVDELSLELRGKTFLAKARVFGLELTGDGQIVFKGSNPFQSSINGQLAGGGMKFTLTGTLEKPRLMR